MIKNSKDLLPPVYEYSYGYFKVAESIVVWLGHTSPILDWMKI